MGQQPCSTWSNSPICYQQQFHSKLCTLCYCAHSPPPPVSHWVFGCGDSRHCPPAPGSLSPRSRVLPTGSPACELYVKSNRTWNNHRQSWQSKGQHMPSLFKVSIPHLESRNAQINITSSDQFNWIKFYHKWYSIQLFQLGQIWADVKFWSQGSPDSHNIDGSVNHYISNQI